MEVRPVNLSLINLPEDGLFFAQYIFSESLGLPICTVPVLIGVQIECVACWNPSYIDPGIVFCMAVCVDVIPCSESTDIAIPRLLFRIPPEFAESFD